MASIASASEYPVHFGWDANAETDLAGYRLYQSDASGQYQFGEEHAVAAIGPGETTISRAINTEQTYYWVLTAVDTAGQESLPSNEVSYTLNRPPAAPANFSITVNLTFNLTAPGQLATVE